MVKKGIIICTARLTFQNDSAIYVEGTCFTDLSSDRIIVYIFIASFQTIFEGGNLNLRRLFAGVRYVGVIRDKIPIRREQINNSGAYGPFTQCRGVIFFDPLFTINREEK